LEEALNEVKKLRLISGNDFRDIAFSLEKRKNLNTEAPQINEKYRDLKAPERPEDAYLKVLSGGRHA
ncbi:IS21 family transposase, partial [Bacillus sp. DJP31]